MGEYNPIWHLKNALKADPQHSNSIVLYANNLLDKGKIDEAYSLIKESSTELQNLPIIKNLLAKIYVEIEKLDLAELTINEALSNLPKSIDLLYTAYSIKRKKGDKYSALHYLERILRIDDNLSNIYVEMAELSSEPHEIIRKLSLLEIAHSLDAESKNVFYCLIETFVTYFCSTDDSNIESDLWNRFKEHVNSEIYKKLGNPFSEQVKQLSEFQ